MGRQIPTVGSLGPSPTRSLTGRIPWYGDGDPGLLIEEFLESPGPDNLTRSKVFEPCAIEHRPHPLYALRQRDRVDALHPLRRSPL
jgi:hypothetical protein